jgi:hypothetical protein
MPSSMLHLSVAKKVNPNASIDFYIGNLAPDANRDSNIKEITHFYNVPDRESALKEFALKATNEYLKGMLLHLFVDGKWWENHLSNFAEKEGEGWYAKYNEENKKMVSYAFHNTEWAYSLYEQMENWDYSGFVETEFITKENVKNWVSCKWMLANKLDLSAVFPPSLIDKFADDTANDFNKWVSDNKFNKQNF